MVVLQSFYTRRFSPFMIYMIPYFLTNSREFRDCKLHKPIIIEASVINEEIPESSDEFYDIRWTKKRDQIFIKLAPNKTNGSDVI